MRIDRDYWKLKSTKNEQKKNKTKLNINVMKSIFRVIKINKKRKQKNYLWQSMFSLP